MSSCSLPLCHQFVIPLTILLDSQDKIVHGKRTECKIDNKTFCIEASYEEYTFNPLKWMFGQRNTDEAGRCQDLASDPSNWFYGLFYKERRLVINFKLDRSCTSPVCQTEDDLIGTTVICFGRAITEFAANGKPLENFTIVKSAQEVSKYAKRLGFNRLLEVDFTLYFKPGLSYAASCFRTLLRNQTSCDVFFALDDGSRHGAHSLILMARSKRFEEIRGSAGQDQIEVNGVSAASFAEFLEFLYTGRLSSIPATAATLKELYKLAVDYELEDLKMSMCQYPLVTRNILTDADVKDMCNFAKQNSYSDLEGACNLDLFFRSFFPIKTKST